MVGDRYSDIKFGIRINAKTYLVKTGKANDEIQKINREFKNNFYICESLKILAKEIKDKYILTK